MGLVERDVARLERLNLTLVGVYAGYLCPKNARHAPVVNPTYPVPMIETFIFIV
jgi:hypothetical protein